MLLPTVSQPYLAVVPLAALAEQERDLAALGVLAHFICGSVRILRAEHGLVGVDEGLVVVALAYRCVDLFRVGSAYESSKLPQKLQTPAP